MKNIRSFVIQGSLSLDIKFTTHSETIKHLLRSEIDEQKWDACIDRNGMPYGYSWYLDIVTQQHWNALVWGDYELVMPLPFNRKLFGLYQVYQPMLCQQLGVFGGTSTDYEAFLRAIPEQYRRIIFSIRSVNPLSLEGITQRKNLILPLDQPVENLRKAYGKSLRKRIRRAAATQTTQLANEAVDELISIYREALNERLGWQEHQYEQVKLLIQAALDRGQGVITKVVAGEETMAIGFFLRANGRLINLFGASTENGRQSFAMHLLIDHIIEYAVEQSLDVFDFEGSEIPGVAQFFLSYGSQEETYYQYERNSLPTFINWALEKRR